MMKLNPFNRKLSAPLSSLIFYPANHILPGALVIFAGAAIIGVGARLWEEDSSSENIFYEKINSESCHYRFYNLLYWWIPHSRTALPLL